MSLLSQTSKFFFDRRPREFRGVLILSVLMALAELIVNVGLIYIVKNSISGEIIPLNLDIKYLAIILIIFQVTTVLLLWKTQKYSLALAYDVASEIFGQVVDLNLRDFEAKSNSNFSNDLFNETNRIALNIMLPFVRLFSGVFTFLLVIVALIYFYGLTSLLAFVILFSSLMIISRAVRNVMARISVDITNFNMSRLSFVTTVVDNILEVKSEDQEERVKDHYRALTSEFSGIQALSQFLLKFPKYVIELLLVIAMLVIFSSYTMNEISAMLPAFLVILKLLPNMNTIYQSHSQLRTHGNAMIRLSTLIDNHKVNIADSGLKRIPETEDKFSEISVKGLVLPGKVEELNFSQPLRFTKGLTVIIGPSGSGKTTLLKTVLGLYGDSLTRVFVDGLNLNQFSLKDYRNKISYVSQRVTFLVDSIEEYLGPDMALGADIFAQLEIGYLFNRKRPLEDNGKALSGGERQRIAIARVLLQSKGIIILDEALVGLHEEMIDKILRILRKKESIILIVSHQKIVQKYANNIVSL